MNKREVAAFFRRLRAVSPMAGQRTASKELVLAPNQRNNRTGIGSLLRSRLGPDPGLL